MSVSIEDVKVTWEVWQLSRSRPSKGRKERYFILKLVRTSHIIQILILNDSKFIWSKLCNV